MVFKCDRRIPTRGRGTASGERVTFLVDAPDGATASRMADELVYATAWKRGVFPDKGHKAKPAEWAMLHAPSGHEMRRAA
jgi:hypothetical protein